MPPTSRVFSFTVTPGEAGRRLDQYLTTHLEKLSRRRVQELIAQGRVRVRGETAGVVAKGPRHAGAGASPGSGQHGPGIPSCGTGASLGVAVRASLRLKAGDTVEAEWLPPEPLRPQPEAIPLELLYEDDDLAVVNKPARMAVHAAGRIRSGTLVNALLHYFGALSGVGGELRPGLVHRLDRMSSGALVVAKNDVAHRRLAAQFAARRVEKTYLALVEGTVKKAEGSVDTPVGRDLVRRVRMTTRRRLGAPGVREALSHYRVIHRYPRYTLLEVKISTGRTHQIRVHLASIGHPVVGDTLYGARGGVLARNFLHARRIVFTHPATGERLMVSAPLPTELQQFLAALGPLPALL